MWQRHLQRQYKRYFPKLCFRAKYIFFHIQKITVKNFTVVVTLLNCSYTSRFSSPTFPFQCLSCIFRYVKKFYFLGEVARIFLVMLFSFLKRTLYNTWKGHYRQLQVLIMTLIKKLLWIFVAFRTQRTHQETFWVLYRELLLMNVLETVCGIVLVLLWFRIIGKIVKTLVFHNNTHLLKLSI